MWVSVERYLFNKVYNKLKSNLIIRKQLDGRVFDCVQKDAVYPYIVVGETNVTNKETTTSMVEDVGITLHVYSQARNRDEASQIIQFLGFVLNNEIEIDYYSFIKSRIDTQEVITDIDQYTKHGIIRLVFKYRHNTLQRSVTNGAG
ncbi:DUF3168 domain-containing protein [Staphylococcus aureus]|uniref:DUF3168 domain-containing protein n=2 Tax=Phietavirus TaxID=1623298 RepID=A7YGV2_9CAUD|nr:DUF3168 domain-containing protein [Staphylococcus aureus]YP_009268686.1 tail terminator [Staphylococcus phage 80]YP_240617.1 tail terminator [Staphylococcus phage 52A]AAX91824.1 ORF030 [Staphylococcus phage 52A]ABJ88891.1 conserved hypothetical protein [Staphylococcus phage 80]EGS92947.1 hypothetical protein SA21195_0031 [Staphylococcus aureus subsp. aureus 21195]PNN85339.1 DUF3168 domain-containing protein [Staphylococcus aureus]SUK19682.1 phage protein [Staphylococcus aureus]